MSNSFVRFSPPLKPVLPGFKSAIQPLADLQRQIRHIQKTLSPAPEIDSAVRKLLESQRRFADAFRILGLSPVIKTTGEFSRLSRNPKLLDEAGWLPHYSTPFDAVDACGGDVGVLTDHLSSYYQERWSQIHQDVQSRLLRYDVNDESKATFREALDAHAAGLYRCACPALMLEIERVSRIDLHHGTFETITSQHLLTQIVAELPLSSFAPRGFYGLTLYRRLSRHLYEHISDSQTRDRFARDPVPNRHASVHGYVVYSSMQHSLNMIFMAEFIFQVISLSKKARSVHHSSEPC